MNYGKNDPECVSKVKQLYHDLNLEQVYRDYEDTSYKSLMALIKEQTDTLPSLPAQIFKEFADRIYKRQS